MVKKFKSTMACFLLCVFLVGFPFVKPKNPKVALAESVIVELWNVDTFEGGSLSRTYFLEKAVLAFNKKNKNIYFAVKNLSLDSLRASLGETKPDMISFGLGAGEVVLPYLSQLSENYAVRQDLMGGGKTSKGLFAVPYTMGGYAVMRPKDKAGGGLFAGYTQNKNKKVYSLAAGVTDLITPLVSVLNQGESITHELSLTSNLTVYEAYEAYCNGQAHGLLGTQRDVYKIQNKVNNGVLPETDFLFLPGFSDIVQYMGIVAGGKEAICRQFLQFVLGREQQSRLCEIGMFNVIGERFYAAGNEKAQEEALAQPLKTISVFTGLESLKEMQNKTLLFLKGNQAIRGEIEKCLL